MPKYKVKAGQVFGPGGRYPAGTVLELTEAEAAGFKDKLVRVIEPGLVNDVEGQPVGLRNEVEGKPLGLKNELGVEVPEEATLAPHASAGEFLPTKEEPPVSTETAKKPRTQRKKSGEG